MKANIYSGYTMLPETLSKEEKRTKLQVNANTLDNLLNQNGMTCCEINWIKIDVEGAELEVLKGARNTLSYNTNITLLIEVHKLADGSTLYCQIKEYLESHGFQITFEVDHRGGDKHLVASKHF
jgi:hypothetical protein